MPTLVLALGPQFPFTSGTTMNAQLTAILFATLASVFWAVGPFVAAPPLHRLGTFHFTRLSMVLAALLLLAVAVVRGGPPPSMAELPYLVASSLFGLVVGDLLIWHGLKVLGPRRNGILFALNIPFTLILAFVFLDERSTVGQVAGIVVAFLGIVVAIAFKTASTADERQGRLVFEGIAASVGGALCQALGAVLAKPAFAAGLDPSWGAAWRVAFAAAVLWAVGWGRADLPKGLLDRRTVFLLTLSTLLGPGLGLLALTVAVATGKVALASMFSSLSPLLMLPIQAQLGIPPRGMAWVGCLVTMAGTALILLADGSGI